MPEEAEKKQPFGVRECSFKTNDEPAYRLTLTHAIAHAQNRGYRLDDVLYYYDREDAHVCVMLWVRNESVVRIKYRV